MGLYEIISNLVIFTVDDIWNVHILRTHFGFFDHRRFLVDQLWSDSSRDPVVKNASYLICIEVQTLNY